MASTSTPWGTDSQPQQATRLIGGRHVQVQNSGGGGGRAAGFPRPGTFQSLAQTAGAGHHTSSRVLAPPGGASSDIFGSSSAQQARPGEAQQPQRRRLIGGKIVGAEQAPGTGAPRLDNGGGGLWGRTSNSPEPGVWAPQAPLRASPLHQLSSESPFRQDGGSGSTHRAQPLQPQQFTNFSGRNPLPPIQDYTPPAPPQALPGVLAAQRAPDLAPPFQGRATYVQEMPQHGYGAGGREGPGPAPGPAQVERERRRGYEHPVWIDSFRQLENSLLRLSVNGFVAVADAARMVHNYNLIHNLQLPPGTVVETMEQSRQGTGATMVQVHEFCERLLANLSL